VKVSEFKPQYHQKKIKEGGREGRKEERKEKREEGRKEETDKFLAYRSYPAPVP
jgi:hypothetical protein